MLYKIILKENSMIIRMNFDWNYRFNLKTFKKNNENTVKVIISFFKYQMNKLFFRFANFLKLDAKYSLFL